MASDVKVYINGEEKVTSKQAGSDRSVNTTSNGVYQLGIDISGQQVITPVI